jgi:hypothetical protein
MRIFAGLRSAKIIPLECKYCRPIRIYLINNLTVFSGKDLSYSISVSKSPPEQN